MLRIKDANFDPTDVLRLGNAFIEPRFNFIFLSRRESLETATLSREFPRVDFNEPQPQLFR